MSLPNFAIGKRTVTAFTTALLLVSGVFAYTQLGQLEDPEFTVKTAVITTTYPGASAEEVELEVTDRIEIALQEMPQVKYLESNSRPGTSNITVEILAKYPSGDLPQIWDELRKKVRDVRTSMPPGVGEPIVGDDFGDVYGFLLAVTADGFTYAQLEDYVDAMKKELSRVDGVSRVELWGEQTRCIYLDTTEAKLSQLGVTMEDLHDTLTQQNLVVDSGGVDLSVERLRIEQTGAFTSPRDIGDLVVRGRTRPRIAANDELLRIRDVATIRRGYIEPPFRVMRYRDETTAGIDELPTLGIAISNVSGVNVVDLGHALDRRLEELQRDLLPVGIEFHRVSWQSDAVTESIDSFMISLAQAVAIVLAVLWIAMGFRVAMIVGLCGLVFTIIISFLFMGIMGIDLQRMSLGALIIAMGMMVDNAIVVADGILVRVQKGMDRTRAALEAATQPAWPLLGATVIAVMAFYPIYASDEGAGEYCVSLFQVVAISLSLSWVLSVTITPLMCIWLLPKADASGSGEAREGAFVGGFRRILEKAIRYRWPVMGALAAILVVAALGFSYVDRTFFPDSARLQVMIDYWAPHGTRIQTVSEDLKAIEDHLVENPDVASVNTFVGQGPPRFYLPVDPEKPYQSYGQIIVNMKTTRGLNALIPEIDTWAKENVSQARTVVRRYGLGPSETWKVEARISGPAVADADELRAIAAKYVEKLQASPNANVVRTNWRQRTKKVVADYDQNRARWAAVSRADIARATRRGYDGDPVGQYREGDKLLPIVLRHSEVERGEFARTMTSLQVHPTFSADTVPLAAVTAEIDIDWEDPIIWRRDRRRTITVQACPSDGVAASALRDDVLADFKELEKELPSGYALEWGGEFESSRDSQQSLIPGIVPAMAIMAMIIVGLFNAFRPPLIIACVIPFALIGVTIGLLVTGQPFGFLALLGAMSLAGMMIKNAIVLLDQVDIEKAAGKSDYQAVMDAALSRLRPVVLAAGTTVLGVIPLLPDVFWVAMAVTIMFGLAFGTVLTMIVVPVLYAMFFRIPAPGPETTDAKT